MAVSTVATALLVAVAAVLPVPYAISGPGPTRNTLGDEAGVPLITIDGAPTYDSTGELLLTTVSVAGGPGYPVTTGDVLRGWADGTRAVSPVELVFAPSESQDDIDQRNQAEMVSSQENATVAALEELGYTVPTTMTIADVVEGTGAAGVLEADDVIVAVDGQATTSFSDLTADLDALAPGDTVSMGVERAGERLDLDVVTTDNGAGGALLGVLIDPTFELPVDVSIQIENIGGPSAGTMFALGIIDRMTPEDEANGVTIAGTGTMDLSGEVGPIGGIRQKLVGAQRDGATWFLAPAANCDEVVGHVPDGLGVLSIATLAEARAAMEAIGAGTTDGLPTCD
ncbi:MAG: PDZ domain-containing protein [Cellulomonadaceae bacterium]|nr:PDZ domain-containing protein [Cellulomonadaceae bacterium]